MNFYKSASMAISLLYLYLFLQLFFDGVGFVESLGLPSNSAIPVLCKRTSIFVLGLCVLMFSSRNLIPSQARQYICLSNGITMTLMSCMGSYELIRGSVNSSILVAIIIEIIFGVSFLILFFKTFKTSRNANENVQTKWDMLSYKVFIQPCSGEIRRLVDSPLRGFYCPWIFVLNFKSYILCWIGIPNYEKSRLTCRVMIIF